MATVYLGQADVTSGYTLTDGNSYVLTENITLSSQFTFAAGSSGNNVSFDGSGNTITIANAGSWAGLFKYGKSTTSVSNLVISASGSTTLASNAGWLFKTNTAGTATNCISTGSIGTNGGGIFGSFSTGTAISCSSSGTIGLNAGGIFGPNSTGTATTCTSSGTISGTSAGGIFGNNAGVDSVYGHTPGSTATGCSSTGDITGSNAGGIYGYASRGAASQCSSEGAISGAGAGGIFGANTNALSTATTCYHRSGAISGVGAGGILGATSQGSVTNCYNSADITNGNAGGICGSSTNGASVDHCYSTNSDGYLGASNSVLIGTDSNITPTNSGVSVVWTDSTANSYLQGYPGASVGTIVWAGISGISNVPYDFATTATTTTTTTTAAPTTTTTTAAPTTTTTTAAPSTYVVIYNANGSSGGAVPVDTSSPYTAGSTVTVLGSGSLFKTGFVFLAWNTHSDGFGISYSSTNTFTITDNTNLYAQWNPITTTTTTTAAPTTTTTTAAPTTTTTTAAPPSIVCFLGHAPVATPTGPQRIDSLKEGDLVLTETGESVPIQRVKVMRVRPGSTTNPYVIAKGQHGATEELLISPRHRVAVCGAMVEAQDLGLPQKTMAKPFNYYNIELPGWANMRVAGVEVESLAPAIRVVASAAQVLNAISKLPKTTETLKTIQRLCKRNADGTLTVYSAMKA